MARQRLVGLTPGHEGVAWTDTILPIDADTGRLIRTQSPQPGCERQGS